MVSCDPQVNVEGDDYVCGWDETDSFCTGNHCEVCSISLCNSDCGDNFCARTRSPADREYTKCMLCAHPLEEGEEFNPDHYDWFKDGKGIEWSYGEFSYPEDYDAEGLEFTDWANQETKHHGKTSLKDWADHEIKSHGGKMSFQDWAKHEDKSHIDRYGAERVFMGWKQFYQMHLDDGMDNSKNQIGNLWNRVKDMGYCPCDRCSKAYYGAEEYPCDGCGVFSDSLSLIQGKGIDTGNPIQICSRCSSQDEGCKICEEYGDCESDNCPESAEYEENGAEELKKDSCCCGATKTHPCACMIQGIETCSATCPCSLEKKGAEDKHWKIFSENLENCKDKYFELSSWVYGYFHNRWMDISDLPHNYDENTKEIIRQERKVQFDRVYGMLKRLGTRYPTIWRAENWGECEYCGTKEEEELTEIREDSWDGPRVLVCDRCLDIAMYGAEEGEKCPTCYCDHDSLHIEETIDNGDYAEVIIECDNCGMWGSASTDKYEWGEEEGILTDVGLPLTVNMMNPNYGTLRCPRCSERFEKSAEGFTLNAENWGGDPTGKLALMLQKVRDKAKKPKKPLKIEKLEAETFEAQAPRGHKMMTAALGKKIPPMDSQEGMGDGAIVYAHYFNPYGVGEWWILEWDGEDEMFGYADLGFPELGYISLSELENVRIGGMGLPLERDLHWREKTLGEVKQTVFGDYRAEGYKGVIPGIGKVRIIEVPTPEPKYDEEGRTIRMCSGCMRRKGFRINPGRGRKNARRVKKDIEKGIYDEGDWAEVTYWCQGTAIRNPREGEGEKTTPHEWVEWETTPEFDAKQNEKYGWDAESWGETHQATIEHFLGYSNRYSPTERIEDMVGGSYGFAEEDIDWLSIRWYLNDALTNGNIMSEYGEDNVKEALEMLKTMNAETSGQWEIGEQLEEAQMNAEYEDCEVCYATVDKGTLNDVQAGRICNECHRMNQYTGGTRTIKTPYNAEFEGNKLMVGSHDFDDGSMMVGVGTEDIGADDPDFMEMMIDKTGKIDYFSLPLGKDGFQRTYGVKPSHYGKMVTEKETNASKGGDFDRKHAEPYADRTPEQQAYLDERKRKNDYRLALGETYPKKCTYCLVAIHKGLEDGSLTQEEFDTYMNDPMFPNLTSCERHDYWIAEDEKEKCPSCQEVKWIQEDGACDDCRYCEYCEEHHPDEVWDICNAHHYDKYAYAAPTKGIDTFTKPFEEASLDSGGMKKWVVGGTLAVIAALGIYKWK